MAKKKNTPISVSQEETAQAQHVFEHYHQIAHDLRVSEDQKQAETALTEINTLSESAQIALLKELSKEHQVDAADVLIALNELSPLKSVRKEARRSLIQLESARIYPHWQLPDEGMIVQNLSIEDLQNKLQKFDEQYKAFAEEYRQKKAMQLQGEDVENYFEEVARRLMQAIYYTNVLIKKQPDQSNYEVAVARMVSFKQYERCLAYLIPMIQLFPEKRGLYLRQQAEAQQQLSQEYYEKEDDEQAERYQELAQEALHESLALENSFEAHNSLAELLIDKNKLDEAEDHLLQAKDLITNPEEEAHFELRLGEIATKREDHEEALSHFQRTIELQPDLADAWFGVGEVHQTLKHFEEAETSYKHAIELEPDNIGCYYRLSHMHTQNNQPSKAIKVLEEGLIANPGSITLHICMASIYLDQGDYHQTEIFLKKAERINPGSTSLSGGERSQRRCKTGIHDLFWIHEKK